MPLPFRPVNMSHRPIWDSMWIHHLFHADKTASEVPQ
jgi:hypothetical protein